MVPADRSPSPPTPVARADAFPVPGLPALLRRALPLPLRLWAILAGVLLWQVSALIATNDWVDRTDQVIAQIQRLERLLLEARAGVHGLVFTGDRTSRDAFDRARRQLESETVRLSSLVSDNPTEVTAVAQLTHPGGQRPPAAPRRPPPAPPPG